MRLRGQGPIPPDDACGCDDYSVSRRRLLQTAALAGVAGATTSMFGDVLTSTVYGATDDHVLVVVSLRGGADGLSMVVPHAESAYYEARPDTAVEKSRLLAADDTFGLHPAFAPLLPLWQGGRMAAIQAVGLPTPNRSHFEAMEELEDASPGSQQRVGWLNRLISGLAPEPDVFDGMQLGSTIMQTALFGPAPSVATNDFGDLVGLFKDDPELRSRVLSGLGKQWSAYGGEVGAMGTDALSLARRAKAIDDVISAGPHGGAQYSENSDLGEALSSAAGLIRARVGVRAIAVDSGGWDHHIGLNFQVNQRIGSLATNLAAFTQDLGADADRVTVVTISEFGRRLGQNGSGGVDHGYGNAMLALGAGVKGGYYSRWPGLDDRHQVDGDLAVTTDYRSVLGEILRSQFGSVDVSKVFPGSTTADPLGFMV